MPPLPSLPGRAYYVFGLPCWWRMMSCLLQLACCCFERSSKPNEARIPHSRHGHWLAPEPRSLRSPDRRAHREDDGGCTAHLLLPCAFGLDGIPAVPDQLRRFGRLSHPPRLKVGYCCAGQRRGGRGVLYGRADYRSHLGATGLGHLVDLGPAPYFDPGAVADLCELFDPATVFHQQSDSAAGGRSRHLWRIGCPPGLFLHLVFPHPASLAGDRRRGIARSPHGPRAASQLGRIPLAGVAGLFYPLSPRSRPARSRRGRGRGVAARGLAMNSLHYLYAAYIATW